MNAEALKDVALAALADVKADDVRVLDVRGQTSITDFMIIASGRSDRQVRAMAGKVVEHAKKHGARALGVEGERAGEWVLIDLGDVIVHAMLPQTRELYQLEKLWAPRPASRQRAR